MKSKEWHQGRADLKEDNSIRQINTECRYLHLEEIKKGQWLVGIINSDGSTMTFHLNSKSNINCQIEEEKVQKQSYPFAEEVAKK